MPSQMSLISPEFPYLCNNHFTPPLLFCQHIFHNIFHSYLHISDCYPSIKFRSQHLTGVFHKKTPKLIFGVIIHYSTIFLLPTLVCSLYLHRSQTHIPYHHTRYHPRKYTSRRHNPARSIYFWMSPPAPSSARCSVPLPG